MRGQVLGFDNMAGEGVISAEDGQRYSFRGSEWKGEAKLLSAGRQIDFDLADGVPVAIYPVPGAAGDGSSGGSEKSHVAAGLLALFLGGLGIHKFYLGYNQEGVILLISTFVSWILLFILIGFLGLFAIGIITLIEAVIYLTTSQADFDRIYVEGRKGWF